MSMGRLKASMPTKCMAQIPMPIANAPPDNQYRAAGDVGRAHAVRHAQRCVRRQDGDP